MFASLKNVRNLIFELKCANGCQAVSDHCFSCYFFSTFYSINGPLSSCRWRPLFREFEWGRATNQEGIQQTEADAAGRRVRPLRAGLRGAGVAWRFFEQWFGWVSRSRLKPLIKVAQILKAAGAEGFKVG